MVKFSLRSRDFGLTFADAKETTKPQVFEALHELVFSGVEVVDLLVAEEIGHKTGKRHYHCYIKFEKKVTAKETSFDVCGLHPHIAKVKRNGPRSIKPMISYLCKEDIMPISTFDWRRMLQEPEEKNERVPDWDTYFKDGCTQEEVVVRLGEDGFSDKFANHFCNWIGYIRKRYPSDRKPVYLSNYTSADFKIPEELAMWKFQFLGWMDSVLNCKVNWYRPLSLMLIGPSRSGKTEWARHFGHHMYFNGMLNLDDWDEDADYIVLDDFSCEITKYFPCWKCFFGGQKTFTLTDKYRGKKTVTWGKPMIWLSNEDPFKHLNIEQTDFIKRNCSVIVLTNKLY